MNYLLHPRKISIFSIISKLSYTKYKNYLNCKNQVFDGTFKHHSDDLLYNKYGEKEREVKMDKINSYKEKYNKFFEQNPDRNPTSRKKDKIRKWSSLVVRDSLISNSDQAVKITKKEKLVTEN